MLFELSLCWKNVRSSAMDTYWGESLVHSRLMECIAKAVKTGIYLAKPWHWLLCSLMSSEDLYLPRWRNEASHNRHIRADLNNSLRLERYTDSRIIVEVGIISELYRLQPFADNGLGKLTPELRTQFYHDLVATPSINYGQELTTQGARAVTQNVP